MLAAIDPLTIRLCHSYSVKLKLVYKAFKMCFAQSHLQQAWMPKILLNSVEGLCCMPLYLGLILFEKQHLFSLFVFLIAAWMDVHNTASA